MLLCSVLDALSASGRHLEECCRTTAVNRRHSHAAEIQSLETPKSFRLILSNPLNVRVEHSAYISTWMRFSALEMLPQWFRAKRQEEALHCLKLREGRWRRAASSAILITVCSLSLGSALKTGSVRMKTQFSHLVTIVSLSPVCQSPLCLSSRCLCVTELGMLLRPY